MSGRLRTARRRQRLLRKQNKHHAVALNLVSMIDMFTVLVFFLLITSGSVATLRSAHVVTLPNSDSDAPPQVVPVVTVDRKHILLQGEPVMSVTAAERDHHTLLEPLKAHLLKVARIRPPHGGGTAAPGTINIMADRSIPYSLLRKIMATCGEANFRSVSLSVNHVAEPNS